MKVCLRDYICFLFIFFSSFLFGQNRADSLKAQLATAKDTNRVNLLINLIEEVSDYDAVNAKKYAKEALELAKKLNFKKGLAQSNFRYALELWYEGNLDASIPFFDSAYKYYILINRKKPAASVLNSIGSVYKEKGDFDKALDYQFRALKIKEEMNDKRGIGDCYLSLGNLFRVQREFKKAEEYYKKSLEINKEIKDQRGIAAANMGLGNAYYSRHSNDTALQYYLTSLNIVEQVLPDGRTVGDANAISTALYNIGLAYTELHIYNKAIPYYLRSLKIKEEQNDKAGIAYCYVGLGLAHFYEGEYIQARSYQEKALALYEKVNAKESILTSYSALAKTLHKLKDDSKAFEYLEKYSELKDSIFSVESKAEMAKMEGLYKTEKKDKEIMALANENQIRQLELKQARSKLYAIIGISVFALLSIILFFNQRRLKQKKKILEEKEEHQKELLHATVSGQEKERKRIATELHDGLGGLLSAVKINLDSYSNKIKTDKEREELLKSVKVLDGVCTDLRDISHNLMPGVLLKLGLVSALRDFTSRINTNSLKVQFEAHGMEQRLDETTEITLFRVVQEAANNMIKHAEATSASIQVIRHDDTLTVMIEDNGKSFNVETARQKNGLGLKNIESRIVYLGGKVSIDSDSRKGTCIIIELPYKFSAN